MSELTELYQELILDHNARPRNFGPLTAPSHRAAGVNPLCGDKVEIYLQVEGDVVADVRFDGQGCAISKASASLMTESLRGKPLAQAQALFRHFHAMVTAKPEAELPAADAEAVALGKLEALAGVRGFPMRIKCATLAWHTFQAALAGRTAPISTEAADDVSVAEVLP